MTTTYLLIIMIRLFISGHQDIFLHQPSDMPGLADQDPSSTDEGRSSLWPTSSNYSPWLWPADRD